MIVHRRRDEADGVVSLVLGRTDGGELPAWSPGAHVDVTLGDGTTRQYSLCSDPSERATWRIGVLREPAGRGGSRYVHDKLHDGDIVEVGLPRNHFALEPAGHYLFVAGGIGITPILPMITSVQRAGAGWTLLYGGRSRTSMAFTGELRDDRVVLAPQDETGLLDLDGLLGVPVPGALVYACGPGPMLDAVVRRMDAWPAGSLRVERFGAATVDTGADATFAVEFAASGVSASVPPGASVLAVAQASGIAVDWSCREGTCGTCETTILDGRADHRDTVLTDDERDAHDTMMICVSRAERGCGLLRLDL